MQTGEVESNGTTPLYSVFNHVDAPQNIASMAGISIPNFGSQVTQNSEGSFAVLNESQHTLRANDLQQKFSSKELIVGQKVDERPDSINKDLRNDLLKNEDFVTFQQIPIK